MPQKIFVTRTDWVAVSRIVSKKLGRKYAASYCREVARGVRNSAPLEKELKAMKLMAPERPVRQRVAKRPLTILLQRPSPTRGSSSSGAESVTTSPAPTGGANG